MKRHRVKFLMFFYTFAKEKDDHNLHKIRLPDKRDIRVSFPQQLSLMPVLLSAIIFKQLL